MKCLFIVLFSFAFVNGCFGQTTKEQKFQLAVREIVTGFSRQDSSKISKYIRKDIGVYLLHRIGIFNTYDNFGTVSFTDPSHPAVLLRFYKGVIMLPLKYATLPTFDCVKEAWSKKGLFVDTTKTSHLLSRICKDRNKNVPDNIPAKKIRQFVDLENKSRRVVLNDHRNGEFVFYLTYVNGKWFLTIIDTVTSDCSV